MDIVTQVCYVEVPLKMYFKGIPMLCLITTTIIIIIVTIIIA